MSAVGVHAGSQGHCSCAACSASQCPELKSSCRLKKRSQKETKKGEDIKRKKKEKAKSRKRERKRRQGNEVVWVKGSAGISSTSSGGRSLDSGPSVGQAWVPGGSQ